MDELLTPDDLDEANRILQSHDLTPTTDYQEDIFAQGMEVDEDIHFLSTTEQFDKEKMIPDAYCTTPLSRFVWAVTYHQDRIPESDIIRGANAIQRRQAVERWKSEEGKALLDMSDEPFEKAGRRLVMPTELRSKLVNLALSEVLRSIEDDENSECCGWILEDATIVRYQAGESQVPHVDPCDATVLFYLDVSSSVRDGKCASGGETCFPLANCNVEARKGGCLLFFSSLPSRSSSSVEGYERDLLSLHHGARVESGVKVVAQLMFSAAIAGTSGQDHSGRNRSWL
eukprot:CAMPEP_0196809200 /NCGR_PEP_ID=MMETSP1362-20130617/9162_1 /TAXON_ID=163516 /ORGANISM="Leptocylindrus danicus, Strain CCMP1856" /LENGTH=285 /DNA_ID=CAMNT_0042183809 /DNA_START=62 /DNA_END=916 /DNA_ORIENTATION=+